MRPAGKHPTRHLSFDWEEGIFRGLLSLWRRVKPDDEAQCEGNVSLAEHQRALSTLAQLVAGEPVRVLPARDLGGVRGRDLLLPRSLCLTRDAEQNRRVYVVRVCVSAAMRRETRDACVRFTGPLAPLESLWRADVAIRWLVRTLPRFEEMLREAVGLERAQRPDLATLRGRERGLELARQGALRGERPWEEDEKNDEIFRLLCSPPRIGRPTRAGDRSPAIAIFGEWIAELGEPDVGSLGDPLSARGGADSEELAPDVEELRRVRLDEQEKQDAVLIHTFEKVETLDSYRGGARDTDGADELDAHLDALREVDLGDLVRGEDAAHSVLRADLQMGISVPDVEAALPVERGLPYPEWDARRRRYREDWCTVYPGTLRDTNPQWASEACARHRHTIRDLRRRLEIHRTGLRPVGRQLDGEDIDLAALVDAHATRRAGRNEEERWYVRQEKQRRDYATTVLIDTSLSTDSWVENRRVLDVAREAVLVLGEVADELGDRLQVLTFASETRHRCRVFEVKGWRDPWKLGRARLGALEPAGYTRIGPAVRHATDRLAAEPADRRLLLLVSDGKPTDYDRYEGAYGVSDVRQALREAERRGICAHALAVDAIARDYLPAMFGAGAWHVLPHPGCLPTVLTTVYGRLTSG